MSDERPILSITELNQLAKTTLETAIPTAWVQGEISNLSTPASGHCYFTLKDKNAQVRCALFRFQRQRVQCHIENGAEVVVEANVTLYEARGDYQLIIRNMTPAGKGSLQQQFEQLKKTLHAEGLFSDAHKQALPKMPQTIGVITSPTGAAVRDIIKVLKRRHPSATVIIYPTQVQGDTAAKQIAAAVESANRRAECDVLLLSRGGGSLEDLWPFNEEIVARAVYKSQLPIVSGVGHEVDITIVDFVADHRAATPSAAAETVSPDMTDLLSRLTHLQQQLKRAVLQRLALHQTQLHHLAKRVIDPRRQLENNMQRLDDLSQKLQSTMRLSHQNRRQQLTLLTNSLQLLNPTQVLERGFAILTRSDTGKMITSAKAAKPGDNLTVRLHDGSIATEVQ